jgi:hypothetical protein
VAKAKSSKVVTRSRSNRIACRLCIIFISKFARLAKRNCLVSHALAHARSFAPKVKTEKLRGAK